MTQTVSSLISELTLLRFSVCATWAALINKWWTRAGRGPVEMADVWFREVLHKGHVLISEDQPIYQRTTVAFLHAAVTKVWELWQRPSRPSTWSYLAPLRPSREKSSGSKSTTSQRLVWRLEARRCCVYALQNPTSTAKVSLCYNHTDILKKIWQKYGIYSQSPRIQSRQDVAFLCSALADEAESNGGLTFGFFPELLR